MGIYKLLKNVVYSFFFRCCEFKPSTVGLMVCTEGGSFKIRTGRSFTASPFASDTCKKRMCLLHTLPAGFSEWVKGLKACPVLINKPNCVSVFLWRGPRGNLVYKHIQNESSV